MTCLSFLERVGCIRRLVTWYATIWSVGAVWVRHCESLLGVSIVKVMLACIIQSQVAEVRSQVLKGGLDDHSKVIEVGLDHILCFADNL